jgi:PAS domain S-box-containing protein
MQTPYKRFSVAVAFGLLLAVLAVNAFIMRRQLSVQMGDEAWVVHTRQVLFESEQTESLLKDAETGQRGFLYTGDPIYLAPYSSAAARIAPYIDDLARLTADNPRQQERIIQLRGLAHEKLSELADTISLYQSGKTDEARAVVLSNLGKSYMDDIRRIIAQMEQEENSLEAARTAAYRKSQRNTIASIYLASGLAVFGLVVLAYYILREIDLREKHARQIRAREEWSRVTLTSIGDAVIATDPHGKITFLNPVAETLTGTSHAAALGKDIKEVFPIFNELTGQATENPVKKVMEMGRVVELANHTVLKHADGHLIPIEDSAAPIWDDRRQLIGVVLVFRDVTLDKKSQELLRKTEKLVAAARLSATVAHEINNPLEAVVNLIYIAKGAPETPPTVAHHLALAEHELKRVAHITQQTLGFYRETSVPEPIDLAPLVESILGIYSNKLKTKNITIRRDFGEFPPVMAVAGEVRQAISNLISNAVDAVSMDGNISISAQCVQETGGSAVQVMIQDDGLGIPAQNIDRIFEPFFTTKKDVGTGLGLWVAKEIVERYGGSITIGPGIAHNGSCGASFAINLPLDTDTNGSPPQSLPVLRAEAKDPLTSRASAGSPSKS